MKKLQLDLPEGWISIPAEEIIDHYALLGAQILQIAPSENFTESIQVAKCRACQDATAESEADVMRGYLGTTVQDITFQNYEAYLLECSNEQEVYLCFIYFDVDDCIMQIRLEGTLSQVKENWQWVNEHLSWDEDLEDNNGNPLHGEPCLVPPPMLEQMLSFTARDYEGTLMYQNTLPDFFDFLVAESLTPALDIEDLIRKVEMDYIRHGGLHEIDYDELSESTNELLSQYDDVFIGLTLTWNHFQSKMVKTIVAILDVDCKILWASDDLDLDVRKIIEEIEADWF